jgi:hypothetical protein
MGELNRKDPNLSKEGRVAPGKRTDERKHHGYADILGKDVNETTADSGSGPEISRISVGSEGEEKHSGTSV